MSKNRIKTSKGEVSVASVIRGQESRHVRVDLAYNGAGQLFAIYSTEKGILCQANLEYVKAHLPKK